ncbi:hypothetical protein Tco_0505369 [Tanacetum coccineum]
MWSITQEDMNLKLLRSLPSKWKTHALIWRNKQEIETISLDDLYNNLKIYEPEISRSSSTSQNLKNMAFVSSNSTNSNSSTNEADNTAYGVIQFSSTCTRGSTKIDPDDLEEMDLQWEMAMLHSFKIPHKNQENRGREINRRTVTVETPTKNALVAQDGIGGSSSSDSEVDSCSKSCVKAYATLKEQYDSLSSDYKRSQFNLVSYKAASSTAASPAVESFVNSSEMLENQEYHAVPLPYTGNFIPFKPDLTFMDEIVKSENMDVTTIVTPSNGKKVKSNHESAGVKNPEPKDPDLALPLKGSNEFIKPRRTFRSSISKPPITSGVKSAKRVSFKVGKESNSLKEMEEDVSDGYEHKDEEFDRDLESNAFSNSQSIKLRSCGESISDLQAKVEKKLVRETVNETFKVNNLSNVVKDASVGNVIDGGNLGPIPVPVSENPILNPNMNNGDSLRTSPNGSPRILRRGETLTDGGSREKLDKVRHVNKDSVIQEGDSVKKSVSFMKAVQGIRGSGNNKLRRIPISIDESGKKKVDMDPLIEE